MLSRFRAGMRKKANVDWSGRVSSQDVKGWAKNTQISQEQDCRLNTNEQQRIVLAKPVSNINVNCKSYITQLETASILKLPRKKNFRPTLTMADPTDFLLSCGIVAATKAYWRIPWKVNVSLTLSKPAKLLPKTGSFWPAHLRVFSLSRTSSSQESYHKPLCLCKTKLWCVSESWPVFHDIWVQEVWSAGLRFYD